MRPSPLLSYPAAFGGGQRVPGATTSDVQSAPLATRLHPKKVAKIAQLQNGSEQPKTKGRLLRDSLLKDESDSDLQSIWN
jgi:hypothetical protein